GVSRPSITGTSTRLAPYLTPDSMLSGPPGSSLEIEEIPVRLRSAVPGMFAVVLAAGPLGAQEPVEPELRPVRALGGLHLVGALPTGEFADHIDGGFGIGFEVAIPIPAESWFALRADVGWVV